MHGKQKERMMTNMRRNLEDWTQKIEYTKNSKLTITKIYDKTQQVVIIKNGH